MAKLSIVKGATSVLVRIFAQDSSSVAGAGLTGLTSSSSGLVCYRARDDDGNAGGTAISLSAGTKGTWSSGGFVEKDSTNMPGWYEFGIPNAALTTGSRSVGIHLKGATNLAPLPIEVELTGPDNQDGIHYGLACLPNTACTTNASLLTSGTGTDQISVSGGVANANVTKMGGSALSASSAQIGVNVVNWSGQVVATPNSAGVPLVDLDLILGVGVSTATAQLGVNAVKVGGTAQTGRDIGASVLLSPGTGTGQIALTSGEVTVGTNNDKSGYSLTVTPPTAAAITTAVWTDLMSSSDFSTASSIGALLKADINAPIGSIPTNPYTGTPPTAAAIATAFWQDLTSSSDFTTTGSIGKLVVTNLDTNIGSRSTLTQTQVTGGAYSVQSSSCVLGDARIANINAATNTGAAPGASGGFPIIGTSTNNFKSDSSANVTANAVGDFTTTQKTSLVTAAWDQPTSGHTTSGTFGAAVVAAGSAGDPWSTSLPGSYGAGTAGNIVGNNLNAAITSRMATYTQPTGFLATVFGATVGTSTLTQTQVTGGAYSVQSPSCVLGDSRIGNVNTATNTGVAPGQSGGLFISGSNFGQTTIGGGLVLQSSTGPGLTVICSDAAGGAAVSISAANGDGINIQSSGAHHDINLAGDGTINGSIFAITGGVNVTSWSGMAVATPNVGGVPVVDVGYSLGIASAAAGGYFAPDWSKIHAPTTTVNLSGTTVGAVTAAVTLPATLPAGSITDAAFAVPAQAAGRPTGFMSRMMRVFEWMSNKRTRDRSSGTVELFGTDGSTVLETQIQLSSGTVDQQGQGS